MSPSAMPVHHDAVALHTRRHYHQQKALESRVNKKGAPRHDYTNKRTSRHHLEASSSHAPTLTATSSSETSSASSSPSSSPPSSPQHNQRHHRGWQSGFKVRHLQILERELEEDVQEFVASIVPTPHSTRHHDQDKAHVTEDEGAEKESFHEEMEDDGNNNTQLAARRRTRRSSSPLFSPLKPLTRNRKKRKLASLSSTDSPEEEENDAHPVDNKATEDAEREAGRRRALRPRKKVRIVSPPSLELLVEGNVSNADHVEKESSDCLPSAPSPAGIATRRSKRGEVSTDSHSQSFPTTSDSANGSRKTDDDSRKRKHFPLRSAKHAAKDRIKEKLAQEENELTERFVYRESAPGNVAKPPQMPSFRTRRGRGRASVVESHSLVPATTMKAPPNSNQQSPTRASSRLTARRNCLETRQLDKVDQLERASRLSNRAAVAPLQDPLDALDGGQELAVCRSSRREHKAQNDNVEVLATLEATMTSVEAWGLTPSLSGLRKKQRVVEAEKTIRCIVVMRRYQEDARNNQRATAFGTSYASSAPAVFPPPPPPHHLNLKTLMKEYEDVCCNRHGTCLRLPHCHGSTPQSAVRAIDDMLDDLLDAHKDIVEDDEDYVLDRQLYKRSERNNQRNMDRDRIEKLKEQEKMKEHFIQLAYNARSKKQLEKTQAEIEMEAFLSRPIHFDAGGQAIGSRLSRRQEIRRFGGHTQCPLADADGPCPLCRRKDERQKSKPSVAPADSFMRPLFRQIDVDAPDFLRRDEEQDDATTEDAKPKAKTDANGRQKRCTRHHLRARDDKQTRMETVLKLQDMKHSIAFIEEFNQGTMKEIPKENKIASRM